MKQHGDFILLELTEFASWLAHTSVSRAIYRLQHHHTWQPRYADFRGDNHFALQEEMRTAHLERNFIDIAQHFTIFPDGLICTGRTLNENPAGIRGANEGAICLENLGNFDRDQDVMTTRQRAAIIAVSACLLAHFAIAPDTEGVIYHHWFDRDTGERTGGSGNTKTCPGTAFFGGNSVEECRKFFLPLVAARLGGPARAASEK